MQNSKLISALIVLLTSVILSLGIGILNYIAGNNTAISYIFCSIPIIISIFYLGATIHLSIVENKIYKSEIDEYGERSEYCESACAGIFAN